MPTYKRFEDLPVWNAAIDFAVRVFKLTEHPSFKYKGDLVNQLRRAALSVSNNIAEGFERGSTQELINFLYIARGSAGESRSMVLFSLRLGAMNECKDDLERLGAEAESVSRQLRAWLDSLQNSDIEGQRHLNDNTRRLYENDHRVSEFRRQQAEFRVRMEEGLRNGTWGKSNSASQAIPPQTQPPQVNPPQS